MHPPRRTPSPFLWVFSAVYVGVLLAGAYYDWAGLCAGGFDIGRLGLLAGTLLPPLALEAFEHRRYRSHAPWAVALALVAARMALYEIVVVFDCSGFSKFLYLIVPFAAFFLSRRLSYGLALFYIGLFVWRLGSYSPVWYLNQEYVSDLLIFAIGLVFSIAMAGVVSGEAASRRRAETLLADLERSHRQLQAYAEQAAQLAAAEERNRLARDIHDSLGHYLTVISIQLEKALAFRSRDAQRSDEAVTEARHAAREALRDVRHSVSALRDSGEGFSLAAALAELVERTRTPSLAVDLRIEGDEAGFPKPVLLSLYRVAQEGLTNIQKHAQASHAAITVNFDNPAAVMRVVDDGQGFEVNSADQPAPVSNGHFGLQGMRERLELVGGSLHVDSHPNQGTHLRVNVPKPATPLNGELPDAPIVTM